MQKAKSLKVGNGAHDGTDVGPLISPEAKERAVRLITEGIHQARACARAIPRPPRCGCAHARRARAPPRRRPPGPVQGRDRSRCCSLAPPPVLARHLRRASCVHLIHVPSKKASASSFLKWVSHRAPGMLDDMGWGQMRRAPSARWTAAARSCRGTRPATSWARPSWPT